MKSLTEKNKIKSLDDFIRLANSDKDLQDKIKNAKNVDELVKIAKEAGYAASTEERKKLMNAVAGGAGEPQTAASGSTSGAQGAGKPSSQTVGNGSTGTQIGVTTGDWEFLNFDSSSFNVDYDAAVTVTGAGSSVQQANNSVNISGHSKGK